MDPAAIAFALIAGITLSGLTGTLLELVTGQPVSFREPYLSPRRIVRSLLAAALAGPMMLANDALAARRDGAISGAYFAFCAGTSLVWAAALGTATVGVAARLLAP
jgi:hypothetical protein